jgi:hypothetical protein
MKLFPFSLALLTSFMLIFSGCKKVYYDVDCEDVTLCVTNGGDDTLHFTFWGGTSSMPDFDQALAPGGTLCHGYGPFRYYYAEKAFGGTEEHMSGTNAAVIETPLNTYYYEFTECEEGFTITE